MSKVIAILGACIVAAGGASYGLSTASGWAANTASCCPDGACCPTGPNDTTIRTRGPEFA